jgi:hypothetical protein
MIKKVILFFLLCTLHFTLYAPTVFAGDLNVDCPAPPATCSKSGTDPLFTSSVDGYWYPGRSLTKTINLKNSSPETREMAIKGEKISLENTLEEMMNVSIIRDATIIWSGNVVDFYNQEKIGMGIFDPGVDFDYDFIVSMSIEAGDDYQNEETIFDLTLGFWGEPISTPTPTPTFTSSSEGTTEGSSPTSSPTPGGEIALGIATFFEEGILDATTEKTFSPAPTPGDKIKGVTEECLTERPYLPWILLILQAIIILLIEFFSDKNQVKRKRILAVLVTLISIILFYLFRDCHCYSLGTFLAWLCKWYWLVAVLLTLILRTITKFLTKGKPSSDDTKFNPDFSSP